MDIDIADGRLCMCNAFCICQNRESGTEERGAKQSAQAERNELGWPAASPSHQPTTMSGLRDLNGWQVGSIYTLNT